MTVCAVCDRIIFHNKSIINKKLFNLTEWEWGGIVVCGKKDNMNDS